MLILEHIFCFKWFYLPILCKKEFFLLVIVTICSLDDYLLLAITFQYYLRSSKEEKESEKDLLLEKTKKSLTSFLVR